MFNLHFSLPMSSLPVEGKVSLRNSVKISLRFNVFVVVFDEVTILLFLGILLYFHASNLYV